MESVNKFQSLVILLMVAIGILLGQIGFVQTYSEYLITPFLMVMLFLVFLQIPLKDILKSFKNLKFTLTAVIINFIWTPFLILVLGRLFLVDHPELLIGYIMLIVTPCTDWYLIFTGISKGNVALGSSILPLNLVLQLVLLPVYVFLIGGSSVDMNTMQLVKGVVSTLIIPLLCAIIIRKIIINNYQGYFLNAAIVSMFASQGKILLENIQVLLILLIPVLLFFVINFCVGRLVGRVMKLNYEDSVALNLTTLARNSPIALAIAVATFPDRPLISLALIIGPLIELPVLFLIAKILIKIRKKKLKIEKKIKKIVI